MFNRRTFLKRSAAALPLPLLSSCAVWGAPSDRVTLGFIGVGYLGAEHHLRGLVKRKDVEVVAVCDVVQQRVDNSIDIIRQEYAKKKKSGAVEGIRGYGDFRELLANPAIDGVVIATPDHWHAVQCILAARAGKHIYCEKPLTHNIAEGRKIVNEVKNANVVFQTGSQQRSEFGGRFRKAVEAIWNGRIGDLKTIRIGVGGPPVACDLPTQEIPEGTDWEMWLGPAPHRGYHEELCPKGVHKHFPKWRSYLEYAGGGLADMGAHHFDIAQWAMQMDESGPVEVIPPGKDKSQGLRFKYANGVTVIHNEFEEGIKADCVFEGTSGRILVSRGEISSSPETILSEPWGEDAKHVLASSNHHENWLDGIRKSSPTICTAETGHRSATICHLANIGYRLGRPLKWDPVAERFGDDEEANRQLTREARGEWKEILKT